MDKLIRFLFALAFGFMAMICLTQMAIVAHGGFAELRSVLGDSIKATPGIFVITAACWFMAREFGK
jgi:hypothetical protein